MMLPVRLVIPCATVLILLLGAAGLNAQSDLPPDGTGSGPAEGQPATASPDDTDQQPPTIEELQRRIDVLADEIEQLRSGETQEVELTDEALRALGLAPSAAATYRQTQGVSIAGYGETLYENFASEDERGRPTAGGAQLDFLRAIIYAGYRFNDKFLFNSEIEVEHANEISVEFAYVDYLAHDALGVRGGMLLVPMGLINEFHEPTVFLGARRTETETRILPSTWREVGAGIHGSVDRVTYRAYVLNGMDATGFSANGLRGGRQKGSQTKAQDLAVVGRLDVTPTPGVFVGASVYTGGSGQGQITLGDQSFSIQTTIVDVHGQAQVRGIDVRGVYARASVGEALALNQFLGLTGPDGVAETMQGGYLQVGYDVLSQTAIAAALTPYYRYERVDTQAQMPAGFARSLATDTTFHTLGVELKPISNIVVKADYQWLTTAAETGQNQFNLVLGYAF